MQIRYTVYGALSSALFMVLYNAAVPRLSHLYVPSTIYAGTYLVFIPIQHAMAGIQSMVFAWPACKVLAGRLALPPCGVKF